jgi:hypothetical protein
MSGATLDGVLDLVARMGWRIFPSVGKIPAIKNWPNECSRDPDVIRRWWKEWPDAVPSVVTGPRNGIVVLDIDVGVDRNGKPYNGWESIEAVFHWDTAPDTPHVITKRGGSHLYFSYPKLPDDDVLDADHPAHRYAIRNSVSILAPHVDVRGWNGQVVLPVAGTGYTIDPALDFSGNWERTPDWFNHRPRRAGASLSQNERFDPGAILNDACLEIRRAPEGTRHDAYRHVTFRIARLVGLGLLDGRIAKSALASEVIALGIAADGHTRRVDKYFHASWEEGLVAGERRR